MFRFAFLLIFMLGLSLNAAKLSIKNDNDFSIGIVISYKGLTVHKDLAKILGPAENFTDNAGLAGYDKLTFVSCGKTYEKNLDIDGTTFSETTVAIKDNQVIVKSGLLQRSEVDNLKPTQSKGCPCVIQQK